MNINYPLLIDGGLSNSLEIEGSDLNHEMWYADLLEKSRGMDMSYEPARNIIEEDSKNRANMEALKAAKEVEAKQKQLEREKKNKHWWS